MLAVAGGMFAVTVRVLAILARLLAVTRRAAPALTATAAQLLHPQRVSVGEFVFGVEARGFLVALVGVLVARSRIFVASCCGPISILGLAIAPASGLISVAQTLVLLNTTLDPFQGQRECYLHTD